MICRWSCSAGHHDGAGIEPQHLRQIRAGDAPFLARGRRLLLQIGEELAGAIDFHPGHQVLAQRLDALDQLAAAFDGVERPGVAAALLVDVEIGNRRLEQGVVLGDLDVGASGIEDLPRGQGREDHVGRRPDRIQTAAAVEVVDVLVDGEHLAGGRVGRVVAAVEVGADAVMANVDGGQVELGHPKKVGPLQLGLGNPGTGLRRGDHQRPAVGQPQGAGEVDRQRHVARLQRRRLQLHDLVRHVRRGRRAFRRDRRRWRHRG